MQRTAELIAAVQQILVQQVLHQDASYRLQFLNIREVL